MRHIMVRRSGYGGAQEVSITVNALPFALSFAIEFHEKLITFHRVMTCTHYNFLRSFE